MLWSTICQKAFDFINERLSVVSLLAYPDNFYNYNEYGVCTFRVIDIHIGIGLKGFHTLHLSYLTACYSTNKIAYLFLNKGSRCMYKYIVCVVLNILNLNYSTFRISFMPRSVVFIVLLIYLFNYMYNLFLLNSYMHGKKNIANLWYLINITKLSVWTE